MVWPVAALAVLLLGFVFAYGSVVQSRMNTGTRGSEATDYESGG
jgi:hypothetical protein